MSSPASAVGVTRRAVSLLALLVLFQGLPTALRASALGRTYLTAGFGLLYGTLLATAVAVLLVRRRSVLARLDVWVLVLAVVRTGLLLASSVGPGKHVYHDDEGPLVTMAARALASGGHVYGVHFPGTAATFGINLTPLMNGQWADTFGYPPLSVLLAAPFVHALPAWIPVAGLASLGGLVLAAAVMFRVLPESVRPGATLLLLGTTWMFPYARDGYPVFLTLAPLAVVVARWTRIGASGRLSRADLATAGCLGLACSAHQLAWFLTPFVVLGIHLVRAGSMAPRRAAALTARWTGVAAAVFLVVNLPFLLLDGPGAWAAGVTTVLTQHVAPQGLGPVDISYYLTDGTGALGLYSAAALALLLATVVLLGLHPRRLGPALAALPWPAFFLSTRSTETYFMLLAPLWLVGFACLDPAALARAHQWRPALLRRRQVRLLLPALLALPAAALVLAAVLSPPPLTLRPTAFADSGRQGVTDISVTLQNRTGTPLRPAFGTSSDAWADFHWRIVSGPATLAPHATAHYRLRHTGSGAFRLNPSGASYLRVLSDAPMTLTSTPFARAGKG